MCACAFDFFWAVVWQLLFIFVSSTLSLMRKLFYLLIIFLLDPSLKCKHKLILPIWQQNVSETKVWVHNIVRPSQKLLTSFHNNSKSRERSERRSGSMKCPARGPERRAGTLSTSAARKHSLLIPSEQSALKALNFEHGEDISAYTVTFTVVNLLPKKMKPKRPPKSSHKRREETKVFALLSPRPIWDFRER